MKLRVSDLCKKNGITQKELAEKMGISSVGLSQQTNGNPTLETLNKIAEALDVSISDLFEQPQKDVFNCPHCGGKIKIQKEQE